MEQVVRPIRLYGSLGTKFGREHRYVVGSPREALRALGVMIPGFWQELCRSGEHGVRYAVFVGERNVGETQLDLPTGRDAIRIAPVIAGSKAGGVFQTIAGVALAGAGAASMFLAPGNPFGVDMMLMGGSLALGGIAQMLSPQTPTPVAQNQHGMPGIQNVTAQGGPVPLLYGRMRVGSTVISESVQAEDLLLKREDEPGNEPGNELGDASGEEVREPGDGAQALSKPVANRYLNSKLTYTVVDLVSEGEIGGPTNQVGAEEATRYARRSVYLDDVPVENFDGTSNVEIERFDLREGRHAQPAIDWVDAAASEVHVGLELRRRVGVEPGITVPQPWVLEMAEPDVDEVALTLRVSDLRWEGAGKVTNARVDIEFRISYADDTASVARTDTIEGISREYHKTYVFPVQPGKQFRLQVKRTDAIEQGKNADKKHGAVHVESYTKRRTGKFSYPMSALMALSITSDRFDRIPVRSYDLKGLLVEVPTHYDPVKRTCTGAWDGTFKRAWTDNPAWIFRDVLLNRRYGAGEWVQEAYVDRYGLYAIAKYCDESVSNGDGGVEPRFTCNCYITSRTHAFALLQQLASVFRGIAYWSAGCVLSSADMPSDPVSVYNPSNVVDGVFKYTGSSLKSRYTACAVTWCNPLNGYKRAVETVEDAQGIALYGYNAAEITAFGCTSRSQAQRAGAWLLQTSRLETQTISFSVGLDGALALAGQVIEVADPLRSQSCLGGRIKEIDAAGRIVLDRDVQAEAGDFLTVMLPDARAHRVEISEIDGACVRPATALPQTPVQGAAWTIRPAAGATQRFRVVSVSEVGDGTAFSILATRQAPEKYAIVDDAATADSVKAVPVEVSPPKNFRLTAGRTRDHKPYMDVKSDPVPGATGYTLTWRAHRAGTQAMQEDLSRPEKRLDRLDPGKYTVRLQAKLWDGRVSSCVEGQATAHARIYPQQLRAAWEGRRFHLTCEAAGDTHHDHEFTFMAGPTPDFSKAKPVASGVKGDWFLDVADYPHGGYAWVRVRWRRGLFHTGAFDYSEWHPAESEPGVKMKMLRP